MRPFYRLAFAALAVACGLAAPAVGFAQHASPAEVPYSPKAAAAETLRLPGTDAATVLELAAVETAVIDTIRQRNTKAFTKRLQIGIGRDISGAKASSPALKWTPVAGGAAAQWKIVSTGALALRVALDASQLPEGVEMRFASVRGPGPVYGPFTLRDVPEPQSPFWSPVLEGDGAIVELFVPWPMAASDARVHVAQVSHLFVSPRDTDAGTMEKATSGSCEVDLICRSAGDAALAAVGRAVAKMVFSDGTGAQYLCTGTLLNTTNSSGIPYFYSANHCISNQSVANTLTTHWFYDRTSCGSGSWDLSYTQVGGGATLVYADQHSDALLLLLNRAPPGGAVFAGWDAATPSIGVGFTAVHHPLGDYKKVSLGSLSGFGSPFSSESNFLVSQWNSISTGVTEGGSSGSGIFTAVGSPASEYRLRGGLYGGPSSCTASSSDLHDYYSRFDQVYGALAQYLSPASGACTYSLSPTSVTVASGGTSGSLGVTTAGGCAWSVSSDSPWLTSSGSGSGNGTVSYTVQANDGALRVGTLSIGSLRFTVTQQGSVVSGGASFVPNGDFESGRAAWTQSATGGYDIIYTDPSFPHGGSWYAWLGGYDSGTDVLAENITIPAAPAQLRFWYFITTQETSTSTAYDTMRVTLANPATGETVATIATFSNLDRTSGWVQTPAYDLSAFAGQTVRLVFTANMDVSNITNFYIDDITLAGGSGSSNGVNYTALWWNPNESGWGIHFDHQGDIVFGTLFTYDANGNPMWLVMSNGARQSGETFSGPLYRTTGPPFNAQPFTPIDSSNLTKVGTMTVTFSGDTATLSYSVNANQIEPPLFVNKNIQKQVFGSRAASCVPASSDRSTLTNYQDLWWNPNESGWGVNITHQDDILFATLFTYDSSGRGLWLVMSAGRKQPDGSYLGDLYQTTGPPFYSQPFTPIGPSNLTRVGTMQFRFTNGTNGTMVYDVNGTGVTKSITRQVFSTPQPACS